MRLLITILIAAILVGCERKEPNTGLVKIEKLECFWKEGNGPHKFEAVVKNDTSNDLKEEITLELILNQEKYDVTAVSDVFRGANNGKDLDIETEKEVKKMYAIMAEGGDENRFFSACIKYLEMSKEDRLRNTDIDVNLPKDIPIFYSTNVTVDVTIPSRQTALVSFEAVIPAGKARRATEAKVISH